MRSEEAYEQTQRKPKERGCSGGERHAYTYNENSERGNGKSDKELRKLVVHRVCLVLTAYLIKEEVLDTEFPFEVLDEQRHRKLVAQTRSQTHAPTGHDAVYGVILIKSKQISFNH